MTNFGLIHLLREKARESWDYFIADELVSIVQEPNRECGDAVLPLCLYGERYIQGEAWIEIFGRFNASFAVQHYFLALAFCQIKVGGTALVFDVQRSKDHSLCDDSMPSNSRQFLQGPEQVEFGPLRTIVWLAFLYNANSIGIHKLAEPINCASRLNVQEREDNISRLALGNRFGVVGRQLPSDEVQRTSKICDDVGDNGAQFHREGVTGNVVRFLKGLRINIFDKGIFSLGHESADASVQIIDMRLRPFNLELGPIQFMHELNYEYEQRRKNRFENSENAKGARDSRA